MPRHGDGCARHDLDIRIREEIDWIPIEHGIAHDEDARGA